MALVCSILNENCPWEDGNFVTALILITGISFGQVLPKVARIGVHVIIIELQPVVAIEQFTLFCSNILLTDYFKLMSPDIHRCLVKCLRVAFADSYCLIGIIKSEEAFDKCYNTDLSRTGLLQSIREKIKPIEDEFKKPGTYEQLHFTQLEVQ